MDDRDFFVSYNKENKNWAKWVAGTLEEQGFSVFLQAWDIAPGDDFIAQMDEFLRHSKKYIAIWSKSFSDSPYCKKELQTAFNESLTGRRELFLPVRVQDYPMDPLYETTVYIDLFDKDEAQAEKALMNAVNSAKNPRQKGAFPSGSGPAAVHPAPETEKPQFPGCVGHRLEPRSIITMATGRKTRKELFDHLVCDVFHALGFGQPEEGHSSQPGMLLRHRTEHRVAYVESSAQQTKPGTAEINAFAGSLALDLARGVFEHSGGRIVGYFVSRSGFTAAAETQAKRLAQAGTEVVLLGPSDIIRELVQGRVICSLDQAINAVRRPEDQPLFLCDRADLLVTAHSWVWALYYSSFPHQKATHFALVHADGNQLLDSVAQQLLQEKPSSDTVFAGLTYLEPTPDIVRDQKKARQAYFQYLAAELGDIQFEGMPTDKDASSVKVKLESIFVPLSFLQSTDHSAGAPRKRLPIRQVLDHTSRAAILARPGGGKSTLIRRIALAYAYPERRAKVADGLPERDWFPVYIRCRDLGAAAVNSISEIIASIVQRAEITRYRWAFRALVEDALQTGNVLLLIDGLDEISSEQHRIRFVDQLRTFVAIYPHVRLLVTSRETGFRAVAGTLTSYCEQYSIASLSSRQVRELSLRWHQAILDNPTQAQTDSSKVCDIILKDPRITALANNPLLLTTLLFVKRWIGYLPTKRCQLYEEIIKLLLVTWNAAAHHRLDLDETEPQLAFIAHYMTLNGQQKITRDQLERCIREARMAMPDLLGYTTVSPSNFIDQVEERSSLLIQQGLEKNERGKLVPSYEFSHLSFQEYLTAKAVVEGWTPEDMDHAVSHLKAHLDETQWLEVVPLAAVLLGRQARPLVEYLLKESLQGSQSPQKPGSPDQEHRNIVSLHLANCIASEIPISQDILDAAIRQIIIEEQSINRIRHFHSSPINVFKTILHSKYGPRYREIVKETLFYQLDPNYIYEFSDAWLNIYLEDRGKPDPSSILNLLRSPDRQEYITGALLMMQTAYQGRFSANAKPTEPLNKSFSILLKLLDQDDILCIFAAAWAVAWSGYDESDRLPHSLVPDFAGKLSQLWIKAEGPPQLQRALSWALSSVCMPGLSIPCTPELQETIEVRFTRPENEFDGRVAVYLAILLRLWPEEKIEQRLSSLPMLRPSGESPFLKALGYAEKKTRA